MTIFAIAGGKFAAGSIGSKAQVVFRGTKNIKGVRGRRPTLTKESATKVAPTAEQREYVREKLAE